MPEDSGLFETHASGVGRVRNPNENTQKQTVNYFYSVHSVQQNMFRIIKKTCRKKTVCIYDTLCMCKEEKKHHQV